MFCTRVHCSHCIDCMMSNNLTCNLKNPVKIRFLYTIQTRYRIMVHLIRASVKWRHLLGERVYISLDSALSTFLFFYPSDVLCNPVWPWRVISSCSNTQTGGPRAGHVLTEAQARAGLADTAAPGPNEQSTHTLSPPHDAIYWSSCAACA